MVVPRHDEMYNALIKALHELGGSASISEMEDKISENMNLSEEDLNQIHRKNRTKFSYRLAWTRTYLKNYGILENSAFGVWALTTKGTKTQTVDKEEVNKVVKQISKNKYSSIQEETNEGKTPENSQLIWEEELLEKILNLHPSSFEKLCQRILRESGFESVKVTGRSGDGGIDGFGVYKLGGLLSYNVVFQCKRYKGNVPSKEIRDFRGAMIGRADKGLFITTGNFTIEAKRESSRAGASNIDLVDGDELIKIMRQLKLGVKIKQEEKTEVDNKWFDAFE